MEIEFSPRLTKTKIGKTFSFIHHYIISTLKLLTRWWLMRNGFDSVISTASESCLVVDGRSGKFENLIMLMDEVKHDELYKFLVVLYFYSPPFFVRSLVLMSVEELNIFH